MWIFVFSFFCVFLSLILFFNVFCVAFLYRKLKIRHFLASQRETRENVCIAVWIRIKNNSFDTWWWLLIDFYFIKKLTSKCFFLLFACNFPFPMTFFRCLICLSASIQSIELVSNSNKVNIAQFQSMQSTIMTFDE